MELPYTTSQLGLKRVVSDIKKRARAIIEANDIVDAYYLADILSKSLKSVKLSTSIEEEYRELISELQVLSLHRWSTQVAGVLFGQNIVASLKNQDIDIFTSVKTMLSFLPLEQRDTVRRQLIRSLDQNQQALTSAPFSLKGETDKPTVGNWLADFRDKLGGDLVEQVKRVDYIANDKNTQPLSKGERDVLTKLFDLYEYLKLSSKDQFGYEDMEMIDDGGVLKVFDAGFGYTLNGSSIDESNDDEDVTNVQNSASISDVQQQIINAYQGDQKFEKKVSEEYEKIQKQFVNDDKGLQQFFFESVQNNQPASVVAAFRLLVGNRQLVSFLEQDKKLRDFLTVAWQKKYNEEVAREFQENPSSVRFVRLFIQYVLEDRLGMSEGDAARQGAHLASIFVSTGKKEYNKVAYFDVAAKQFKWFS